MPVLTAPRSFAVPSPAASLRQAHGRRRRHRYADGLQRAVERAGHPPGLTAAATVDAAAGGIARMALLDLAARLRQARGVAPEGLHRVRRLLTDGAGPLYAGPPGALRAAAEAALLALDADGRRV